MVGKRRGEQLSGTAEVWTPQSNLGVGRLKRVNDATDMCTVCVEADEPPVLQPQTGGERGLITLSDNAPEHQREDCWIVFRPFLGTSPP